MLLNPCPLIRGKIKEVTDVSDLSALDFTLPLAGIQYMPQAVFCDEAGFSGNNLLDTDQPFFTYAAVAVDPDDAQELVERTVHDFGIDGDELKGQRLLRFSRGRQAITTVLNACAQLAQVMACHKRYSLAGKFFEYIFEPVLAQKSSIFYNAGLHRFIANIIFFEALSPNRHAVAALNAFQAVMRERDPARIPTIFPGGRLHQEYSDVLHDIETFFVCHQELITNEVAFLTGDHPAYGWVLDLSVTALFTLLAAWGQRFDSLDVYCDVSKPLRQHREHFDMMVGRTDRAFFTLEGKTQPLTFSLAEPLKFVRSEDHCGIQVADVFASAFAYYLRHPDDRRTGLWGEVLTSVTSPFSIFPDEALVDLREERAFVNRLVLRELVERSVKGLDLFDDMPEFIRLASGYRRQALEGRI